MKEKYESRKLRVVICGSTFGQYYIKALKNLSNEFEIVGLLAKGSERSKLCAEFYGIPLYKNIDDIPKVDIACVVVRSRAIGGSGTEIAEKFLSKKVHVIQEQPIHPKDLELCYRIARKNDVVFQTGDLYPNLLEVNNFIKCAQYLNQKESPLYIKAAFCPQVSYPAIDIISKLVPSIHSWKVKDVSKKVGPFEILTGKIGQTPILIEYHNEINPSDPDNYMHLLHNIVIVYKSGRLILEDTFGPTLWKPRMHIPKELYIPETNPVYPEYMAENSIDTLGEFRRRSYTKIITEEWPIAIAEDILNFKSMILSGSKYGQKAQQDLLCSKRWSELTKIFGYAELMNEEKHHYIPLKDLKFELWGNENG